MFVCLRAFSPSRKAVATLFIVLASGYCFGQVQQANTVQIATRTAALTAFPASPDISFDVNLVLVPVTVTDPRNRPVLGLPKEAFTVFEDKKPETIQYFFNEDAPIAVGLVVDFSSSMINKSEILREAISRFFDSANPNDDFYVVAVSTQPTLLADGGNNFREIDWKLAQIKPVGWTALIDGVDLVMRMMQKSRYQRKVVVMISDGGDNNSHISLKRVCSMVAEQNADVYGIGLFENAIPFFRPIEEKLGRHTMAKITDATGGRTIGVETASELPKAVGELSMEIRSQYVLGYRPKNMKHDAKWRKIRVEVKSPAETVRLRASYKDKYFPGGK